MPRCHREIGKPFSLTRLAIFWPGQRFAGKSMDESIKNYSKFLRFFNKSMGFLFASALWDIRLQSAVLAC